MFFIKVKFPPVQRALTRAMLHLCADLVLEGSGTEVVLRTLTRLKPFLNPLGQGWIPSASASVQ